MELVGNIQKYHWGKQGADSAVARLAFSNLRENLSDLTHYAEFWMGVHPSGPSRLVKSNLLLSEYISKNTSTLGKGVVERFGSNLPFLFKVLSVETALSIQAHPSKAHAEELFQKYPSIYKDDNHKPEIAIALTKFEAMCGFKPRIEIEAALKNVPELSSLINKEKVKQFLDGTSGIRPCFEDLMNSDPVDVDTALKSIISRKDTSSEAILLRRLYDQFPGDVGGLCVYWLNYIVLEKGEALFLAPNEPHAYLFGDCVECMANSDNVVRAGLTPKFRDVKTLCEMLTYKSYGPDEIKFQPIVEDAHSSLFKPPVEDFAVALISIEKDSTYKLIPRSSASILLTISGGAEVKGSNEVCSLQSGTVLFLPRETSLELSATSELLLFQAFCNVS